MSWSGLQRTTYSKYGGDAMLHNLHIEVHLILQPMCFSLARRIAESSSRIVATVSYLQRFVLLRYTRKHRYVHHDDYFCIWCLTGKEDIAALHGVSHKTHAKLNLNTKSLKDQYHCFEVSYEMQKPFKFYKKLSVPTFLTNSHFTGAVVCYLSFLWSIFTTIVITTKYPH